MRNNDTVNTISTMPSRSRRSGRATGGLTTLLAYSRWGWSFFTRRPPVGDNFERKIADGRETCRPASSPCEQQPLVSILIPAYNAEAWIADTIKSALAQTWGRKEIIVVDDGSIDSTLAIARQFENDGVHVVTQRNAGAAVARNTALALSSGCYIQWLDADDLLAPDKIEKQMESAAPHYDEQVLLSCPFGRFNYRHCLAEFRPTSLWRDLSPLEWLTLKMSENAYMQTATWLVSRKLTEGAGPWDIRLLGDDDGEYFCRLLLASHGVRFVPDAHVYYRSPFFNTLSALCGSERKIRAHWRSMQLHIAYLRSLDDGETSRAACTTFLQNNIIYFYPEYPDILAEMYEIARKAGGELYSPELSWKFAWLPPLVGWRAAKRLAQAGHKLRWGAWAKWDKLLYDADVKLAEIDQLPSRTHPEPVRSCATSAPTAERYHHVAETTATCVPESGHGEDSARTPD